MTPRTNFFIFVAIAFVGMCMVANNDSTLGNAIYWAGIITAFITWVFFGPLSKQPSD